jgi:hypothetical protein
MGDPPIQGRARVEFLKRIRAEPDTWGTTGRAEGRQPPVQGKLSTQAHTDYETAASFCHSARRMPTGRTSSRHRDSSSVHGEWHPAYRKVGKETAFRSPAARAACPLEPHSHTPVYSQRSQESMQYIWTDNQGAPSMRQTDLTKTKT